VLGQADEGFLYDVFGEVRIAGKPADVPIERGVMGRE
jgi:hypothetical protein